mgnify:FL=1
MLIKQVFILSSAVLCLAGCATDPAPIEQLRITEQAIEQAQTMGADDFLQPAQIALQKAQEALAAEDYRAARLYAERAELDARLAEVQALSSMKRNKVAEITTQIQRLRLQLGESQ